MTGLSRHAPRPPGPPLTVAGAGADNESRGGQPTGPGRHLVCDLLDSAQTARAIEQTQPDAIVHTQAMSDVDRCEREPEQARAQNVQTVTHLVRSLGRLRPLLIYVSTDYVFDGTKGSPYDETDSPGPISVYGRSKVEGERAALAYARGMVVRPSTLFGAGRSNFCDMIVRGALDGSAVEAFIDQTTSPTFTDDVAEAIGGLIAVLASGRQDTPRIVHTANAGGCTRLAFAHRVVDLLGRPRSCVRPIRMHAQQRPAQRPAYSALTTRVLPAIIGRTLRPWDEALEAYLRQRHWLS